MNQFRLTKPTYFKYQPINWGKSCFFLAMGLLLILSCFFKPLHIFFHFSHQCVLFLRLNTKTYHFLCSNLLTDLYYLKNVSQDIKIVTWNSHLKTSLILLNPTDSFKKGHLGSMFLWRIWDSGTHWKSDFLKTHSQEAQDWLWFPKE